tara:strand:- start:60 stop:551 length:492 start_codon:yes stop_codon:yes gene_type:complete
MNTGIIYIIKCKDPKIEQCYIGSTTNLKRRMIQHKYNCNNINSNEYNINIYKFIRQNKGYDNFYFEILQDEIEFNHRKELEIIERFHIEDIGFNLTLNVIIPSRTKKEYKKTEKNKNLNKKYYEKNKNKIKETTKQYRLNNKDKLKQYKKQWYINKKKYLCGP